MMAQGVGHWLGVLEGILRVVQVGPGPPTGSRTGGRAYPGERGGVLALLLRPGPAPISSFVSLTQPPRTPRRRAWRPRSADWQS